MEEKVHNNYLIGSIFSTSWRVGIVFFKLLWGNVFSKNHAKSKVFQNTPSTMPFLNIFFQFEDFQPKNG